VLGGRIHGFDGINGFGRILYSRKENDNKESFFYHLVIQVHLENTLYLSTDNYLTIYSLMNLND